MNVPVPPQSVGEQGIRFILFGIFNTLTTYLVYCLLVHVMHPQFAYALVFALGIGLAYIGNSRFVFRKALDWKTARMYPLVYLAQYMLTAGLLHIFGLFAELGPRMALAMALVFTTPISFVLNRTILNRATLIAGTR